MKVSWIGFLAQNHSWAFVSQNLSNQFIKHGYDVDLFSTNGNNHFPNYLSSYLKGHEDGNSKVPLQQIDACMDYKYDISMSYTAPKNFDYYLRKGNRKFAIWAMEFFGKNTFPKGFAKNYIACDKILAPSKFCYDVFVDQGVPENRLEIIPHGYDDSFFGDKKFDLKTTRSFKFLLNCGQLHKRKNIEGVLETFCKAFSNKDDVALIVKAKGKNVKSIFEISWNDLYKKICLKYPNKAPIILVPEFIEDISQIYRSCNSVVSLSHGEGFNLPILESIASNKIPLCLSSGGQVDFAKEAAIMVDCEEVRAPIDYQYWEPSPYAKMYKPNMDDAISKMRFIYENEKSLLEKFSPAFEKVKQEYSWKNVFEEFERKCLV